MAVMQNTIEIIGRERNCPSGMRPVAMTLIIGILVMPKHKTSFDKTNH
jgi:hypothetical protein